MNMPMHIMANPIQTAAVTESGADFSAAEIIRQNHYCSSPGVNKPETALAAHGRLAPALLALQQPLLQRTGAGRIGARLSILVKYQSMQGRLVQVKEGP
jgi:hypothetical protein